MLLLDQESLRKIPKTDLFCLTMAPDPRIAPLRWQDWQHWLPVLMHVVLSALVLALNSSKAVLSIGWIALISLAVIYRLLDRSLWARLRRFTWTPAHLLMALWLLALLTGFYAEDTDRWLRDLRTKSPLLWLPLAFFLMPPPTAQHRRWLALGFIYAQAVWAIGTLVHLALDYEAQLQRVAQNGNIDVMGSISHIYFGLLLSAAVLLGLHLWLYQRPQLPGWRRWLMLSAVLLCFVTLHVLNSRTAQLGLYAGLGVFILTEILRRRAWVTGGLALLLLLSTPVVAYFLVPSFRTRVEVTLWDYQQAQIEGSDVANNSLSTRLYGWRAAWEVYQTAPLLGVGFEDLRAEMAQRYGAWGLDLPEPMPPALQIPHNLYLKYLAGAGLPGLLLLFSLLIYPLFHRQKPQPTLLYSFLALMAVGFCFENFLERQIGIIFFCLAYLFLLPSEHTCASHSKFEIRNS